MAYPTIYLGYDSWVSNFATEKKDKYEEKHYLFSMFNIGDGDRSANDASGLSCVCTRTCS